MTPFTREALALLAALVAVVAPVAAQPSAPAGLDFTGTWLGIGDDPDVPYRNSAFPYPPPFTAKGRELAQYWADPRNNLGARCLPGGGPAGQMNGGSSVVVRAGDRDARMPYTQTLHLTERMRLLDGGQILEVEQTIDDPTAYTAPYTLMRYWKRSPETPIIEYICTENLRPEDEGFATSPATRPE